MLRLDNYLIANGVRLPVGTVLSQVTAISSDGRTFAGWTNDATNGLQGYVATIPAPGVGLVLGITGVLSLRRRRNERHRCV
jgi:hypothetical protein